MAMEREECVVVRRRPPRNTGIQDEIEFDMRLVAEHNGVRMHALNSSATIIQLCYDVSHKSAEACECQQRTHNRRSLASPTLLPRWSLSRFERIWLIRLEISVDDFSASSSK